MISGVEGVSSAYPIDYARNVAQARKMFSIPESALRMDGAQAAGETAAAERDPIADSVELSRDFPQLLVNQTYVPPTEQLLSLMPGGKAETAAPGEKGKGNAAGTPVEDGEEGGEGAEEAEKAEPGAEKGADGQPLDENEMNQLRELKARDLEVRAHEQAHMAVGGSYAGAASYEYQQGPDGGRYAVGGEVSIDMSPENEPESTIAKMLVVKAAAMAPAEPSPQDYSVAAQATQNEIQARQDISVQQAEEAAGGEKAGEAGETEDGDTTGETGEANGTEGMNGANAGESALAGAAPASAPTETAPAMSGGTASLSSSPDTFRRRSAENAYAAGSAAQLAMASYMPLNVVA